VDVRYRIEIEHNGDEWEVRFPQLKGCVARAPDIMDALDAARWAQEDYLGRFTDAQRWGENCG
jgi:predicted RNase H-like HicB family nuclease